jgi:CHASE3 domain sensor protein
LKTAHKIAASLAGAALLVALGVALSFWSFRQIRKAAEERAHTGVVIKSAGDLLSALKDAETGQRGYLLTGDEAFLEPYVAVRDSVSGQLEELRQLALSSAAHQHLDALAPLVDAKMAELSHVIELRRNQDMTAALAVVGSGPGKRLMDSIRVEMGAFIRIEEDARAQHDAEFQSEREQRRWTAPSAPRNAFASVSRIPARDCPRKSWRNYSSRSTGSVRKLAAWPARASAWW